MTLHIGQPCLSAGCVQWCCENSKSCGHEIKPVLGLDGQVLGLRRSLQQCLCFMSHENAATRKSAAGFRAAFDQFSTSWRHVQAGLSPGLWPAFDWIDSMECGLRSLAGLVLFGSTKHRKGPQRTTKDCTGPHRTAKDPRKTAKDLTGFCYFFVWLLEKANKDQ